MARVMSVVLVLAASCTTRNPAYCERNEDCKSGMQCEIASHRCVDAPLDAPVDEPLTVTASPAEFTLHVNDTREIAFVIHNGTSAIVGTPTLEVTGLTLGEVSFGSSTCTAPLDPETSCSVNAVLTAHTAGQAAFSVQATTNPGGVAMASLHATVMVACAGTCGSSGNANCCASSVIPGNAPGATLDGASFFRSNDVGTDMAFQDASYPARIHNIRLDTYEVTVGRFRAFVNAGYGTQAKAPAQDAGARALNGVTAQGGWDPNWNANLSADTGAFTAALSCNAAYQSWTDFAGANEAKPINCVSWYEAMAFCIWDGGFLPTEAEWNYAAAGGAEQRAYPWSNPASSLAVDCTDANHYRGGASPYCVSNGNGGGAVNVVGSESPKGDAKWGHADMAGNASEWVLDGYVTPYATPGCDDCANLTATAERAVRGGNFGTGIGSIRTAARTSTSPSSRSATGVRCARMP
jgi:formylglycine-generating enzyme required for sulfatase activity